MAHLVGIPHSRNSGIRKGHDAIYPTLQLNPIASLRILAALIRMLQRLINIHAGRLSDASLGNSVVSGAAWESDELRRT